MLEILHTDIFRGGCTVLGDVTLSLPLNTVTALIGRNGCGKSTLISALTGESRYTGSILLHGNELSSLSARERAETVAVLPQSLPAPHMTVGELVSLGRFPHLSLTQRRSLRDTQAVEQAMSDVEISSLRERYLDELSGGERQKAYLAMILAQETPLIVLDEPTTYMDLAFSHRFMEMLSTIKRERKKTVLIAMHDLSLAVRYADCVAVLDGGRLSHFSSVKECLEKEIIERTFGVRRVSADGHTLFVG